MLDWKFSPDEKFSHNFEILPKTDGSLITPSQRLKVMSEDNHFTLPAISTFTPLSSLPKPPPIYNFSPRLPDSQQWWSHPTPLTYIDDQLSELGIAWRESRGMWYDVLSPVSVETIDPRWLTRSESVTSQEEDEMGELPADIENLDEEREMDSTIRSGGKRPGTMEFKQMERKGPLMRFENSNEPGNIEQPRARDLVGSIEYVFWLSFPIFSSPTPISARNFPSQDPTINYNHRPYNPLSTTPSTRSKRSQSIRINGPRHLPQPISIPTTPDRQTRIRIIKSLLHPRKFHPTNPSSPQNPRL